MARLVGWLVVVALAGCGTAPPEPEGETAQVQSAACTAAGWSAVFRQGAANEWWVEYTIGAGTVQSAWLQVGARQVNLSQQWGKWSASTARIATGTVVTLNARNSLGQTSQTLPFGYLTVTQPSTDPCQGTTPPCRPITRGLVSITLDDSWASQYTLARQPLRAHGMKASVFVITGRTGQGWSGYLTLAQAQALAADGHEIASHTVNHRDLTTMTDVQIDDELRLSKQWLDARFGSGTIGFASPFGRYDARVVTIAKRHYQTHGTAMSGLNFPGDDLFRLRRESVDADVTPAEVSTLVQNAQARNGWLILLFHDFTTGAPTDPFRYRASDFTRILDDLTASGVEVVTFSQGAARLRCR